MDEESGLYYLSMSECLIRFFFIKSDKEGKRGKRKQDSQIPNDSNRQTLIRRRPKPLHYPPRQQNIIVLSARDADHCADDTHERSQEELWPFAVFVG